LKGLLLYEILTEHGETINFRTILKMVGKAGRNAAMAGKSSSIICFFFYLKEYSK
jgi:hypothetical protein